MVTILSAYDPTLFQGAAWYYARYRSKYPRALFYFLADIFLMLRDDYLTLVVVRD